MQNIYRILISLTGIAFILSGLQIFIKKYKTSEQENTETKPFTTQENSQKEYIDRDLYPRKHGKIAKDAHHGYYHTVPQETLLYHQSIGLIDHKELFSICDVQQSENEYTDYINLKAKMCNSILQVHQLFENQLFVHLDPFLYSKYKQLLEVCGTQIKYLEDKNEFTGDFNEEALKQILKVGCELYEHQNLKNQQKKQQKTQNQSAKKND